jgi:hypothetical protein
LKHLERALLNKIWIKFDYIERQSRIITGAVR